MMAFKEITDAMESLRIMKQIDNYLISNNLDLSDLAIATNFDVDYIHDLMTGTEIVNNDFIIEFEKVYNVVILTHL